MDNNVNIVGHFDQANFTKFLQKFNEKMKEICKKLNCA